jgi:hypothetical protein
MKQTDKELIQSFLPTFTLHIKLSRLQGGSALRTDEVEGLTNKLPEKGEQLILLTAPLENGDFRRVNTSPVVSYEDVEAGRMVVTESGSQYFIEVIQ